MNLKASKENYIGEFVWGVSKVRNEKLCNYSANLKMKGIIKATAPNKQPNIFPALPL